MKFPKRETSGTNGANFLKIKDGETITGILVGETYNYFIKGFGASSQVVGPNEGGKERFRHNLVVKEDGKLVAKIWEFGPKIYDQLAEISADWDLATTNIKISRTGSTKENTKYTVVPLKAPPSAATMKELNSIELHVLNHKNEPEVKHHATGANDENDEVPF